MTDATHAQIEKQGGIVGLVNKINGILAATPLSLTSLVLRFALAVPFFKSGLTKFDGFAQLSAGAKYLFQEEFKLHIFGAQYGFPLPNTTAFITGVAELVLPIMLVIGLATRFSAFGLLIMTGVIQLVIPTGWANFHLPWAAMALAIMVMGAGKISADHVISRNTDLRIG